MDINAARAVIVRPVRIRTAPDEPRLKGQTLVYTIEDAAGASVGRSDSERMAETLVFAINRGLERIGPAETLCLDALLEEAGHGR